MNLSKGCCQGFDSETCNKKQPEYDLALSTTKENTNIEKEKSA